MQKSIHSADYDAFLASLRSARKATGLTQIDLAERLQITQSTVSKSERGERRLDVVELRHWCQALGVDFQEFCRKLDNKLSQGRRRRRK